MAKRKITATEKLRKLVKQQIRRMENRGFRVSEDIKEKAKSGKYQTLKSLQKGKYKKVYESSTGEVNGKVVSGKEKRAYERKESARKAVESRRRNEREYNKQWERERRQQDAIDAAYARQFDEGQITYNNINDLIERYPGKGSKYLSNLLRSEISKYGQDKVILAMGKMPSYYTSLAQSIIFYNDGSDGIHGALVSFSNIIRGTIMNEDEAKEMGEVLDDIADYDEY